MMAKATMATAKAPAAILGRTWPGESTAPNTIADRRSTRAITGRRNVSTIVGRRSVLPSAGRHGGSRMGVRRDATTARGCRTTVTSCPAKRKSPLPITLGGDVPLEPACAQPSPGRQPRQRPHFPSQTKASDPQPRDDPQRSEVELINKEKNWPHRDQLTARRYRKVRC